MSNTLKDLLLGIIFGTLFGAIFVSCCYTFVEFIKLFLENM